MNLSKNEKPIIEPFFNYLANEENDRSNYLMKWISGTEIYSELVAIDEDDNDLEMDDPNYEEYWSIVVRIIQILKFDIKDKLDLNWFREGHLIGFSYHNFPDEIYNSKGKLISKKTNKALRI